MTTFPRYFCIDFDVYVKVDRVGDELTAQNQFGNPYPPIKALFDGSEVDESAYLGAVGNAKKQLAG